VSLEPGGAAGATLREAREDARRQARTLSAAGVMLAGVGVALAAMALVVALDYRFAQDPHRVVKILLGAAAFAGILLRPRIGLLLLAAATPFLPWMPGIRLPGVNVLNVLLISIFATWGLSRVLRRQPLFRPARLGWVLGALFVVAALSVLRGAAIPSGFEYRAADRLIDLLRSTVTVTVYFVALSMTRGERERRTLAWAVVAGLLLESVVTIALGRNGPGGRATGSIGQSNELGAFLGIFTVVAAALLGGVRHLLARAVLAATVVAGAFATLLSLSRAAILGLALGLLFVSFRTSRGLALITVAVLLTAPFWTPDYVRERLTSTEIEVQDADGTMLEASAQARVDTWRAIATLVSEHPLDGVGFGGLYDVLPETGLEMNLDVKGSSHNSFLRFLGEMGVLGLALFVVLLWRCWALARDATRAATSRFDRQLGIGLGAATLVFACACAFGDRFFPIVIAGNFWILCAIADDIVLESRGRGA